MGNTYYFLDANGKKFGINLDRFTDPHDYAKKYGYTYLGIAKDYFGGSGMDMRSYGRYSW